MANSLYYGENLAGVTVNAKGVGNTQATFDSRGYWEGEPSADLLTAIQAQSGQLVDVEGTEEALTAGTVQTATTLSAFVVRNGTGASVINIRDEDATGTVAVGPITLAAGEERVLLFPTQIPASVFATGVFVEVVSGALNATPGFLIP